MPCFHPDDDSQNSCRFEDFLLPINRRRSQHRNGIRFWGSSLFRKHAGDGRPTTRTRRSNPRERRKIEMEVWEAGSSFAWREVLILCLFEETMRMNPNGCFLTHMYPRAGPNEKRIFQEKNCTCTSNRMCWFRILRIYFQKGKGKRQEVFSSHQRVELGGHSWEWN